MMAATYGQTFQPFTVSKRHFGGLALVTLTHAVLFLAVFWHSQSKIQTPVVTEMAISLLPQISQPIPQQPESKPKPTPPEPIKKVVKTATPPIPVAQLPNPQAVQTPAPPAQPTTTTPTSHQANTTPIISTPRFDAAYLNNPAPAYPALSRRMGEEGRVLLLVQVGPDGLPKAVSIANTSGSERLDNAALAAVWKWKFVPAQQNGQPLVANVNVPIAFKLD